MVKVEMKEEQVKGQRVITLAFECSKPEDQVIVDAVRIAMFGDFEKRGSYVNSNRLIVEIKAGPSENLA